MRTHLLYALPFALAAAACSDSGNGLTPVDSGTPDTTADATDDTSGDVAVDTTPTDVTDDGSGAGDAGTDTSTDAGTGINEAEYFFACEDDSECVFPDGQPRICVNHVCVIPPRNAANLAEEWDEPNPNPDGDDNLTIGYVEERPEEPIDLSCYTDGSIYAPVEGPASATLTGIVERFGSGPPTTGLCVTTYDEGLLLPWLINLECNGLADDPSLEVEFAQCFQLDPCRCDELYADEDDGTIEDMKDSLLFAVDEAGGELEIGSLAQCYAAIGYCDAIEPGADRDACVARVRALSLDADAETLILGHTRSVENPDNADAGLYTLADFPVNFRFAFKVSGRENRWRDTWEYGLFTRGDLVRDGVVTIDSNAVSAGAWRTIPPAVGFPGGISDRNGAVAGAIRDCGSSSRTDRNGDADPTPWNIVHGTVGIAFLDADTRLAYFNGNPNNKLPQPGRVDTDPLGLFAAINLPPGPNRVSPIICTENCGPDAAGEPSYVLAGGRNVFQTPKSVIIATFEGLH